MVDATPEAVFPRDLRITAERIIDLCDPIFAENSTIAEVDKAVDDIIDVLAEAVTHETEELRDALYEMLQSHRYRFPLNGKCHCAACRHAALLVEGDN
jgi:hypothetical protein